MASRISPEWFGRRQRWGRGVPCLIILALLVAGWTVVDQGRSSTRLELSISVANYLFVVLATGGLALGYLGWWFSLHTAGILSTPRQPWELSIHEDVMEVTTAKVCTRFSLDDVQTAVLVSDVNWDKMKGMEDRCLELRLRSGTRLLIPGSSTGFDDMVAQLRSAMPVGEREVG